MPWGGIVYFGASIIKINASTILAAHVSSLAHERRRNSRNFFRESVKGKLCRGEKVYLHHGGITLVTADVIEVTIEGRMVSVLQL